MSLDNSVKQTQIHSIRYRSCVAVFQLLHVIAQVFVRGNVRAEKPYCVYAPPPFLILLMFLSTMPGIYIHPQVVQVGLGDFFWFHFLWILTTIFLYCKTTAAWFGFCFLPLFDIKRIWSSNALQTYGVYSRLESAAGARIEHTLYTKPIRVLLTQPDKNKKGTRFVFFIFLGGRKDHKNCQQPGIEKGTEQWQLWA